MTITKIMFWPIRIIKKLYDYISGYLRIKYLSAYGIKIGRDTFISPKAYFDKAKPNMISVGDNCMITRGCMILCHSDAKMGGKRKLWGNREYGKVKIGNNVFLGVDTVVMPGVTIGDNVIIGAKSLVLKDIPSNCVAFGIPAKKIKNLDDVIKRRKK